MKRGPRVIASAALLIALAICSAPAWAATPGDYDGDGIADLAIIDADQEEDKTTVFVRLSSNNSDAAFVFFPFGNHVISGNFFGNGRTYPGIVSIPSTQKRLEWRIKRPNGAEKVFRFGAKQDQIPNQGDLDCDGKTDYVLVHPGAGGTRVWQARLSTRPAATQKTIFGGRNDLVFTADMDGDGCSEIGSLSPQYLWSSRPFSGESVTQFQWGRAGDIPLLPTDLDGDGTPEYVTLRARNGKLIARTHGADDVIKTIRLGTSASIPMTGNFLGSNGFAWFVPADGQFFLRSPQGSVEEIFFGNPRRGVVRPDGTDVPEGENGSFGRPRS